MPEAAPTGTSADAAASTRASNPLSEADPKSLDTLMSLDPFKMTEQDRSAIVQELRRQRAIWAAAEASGATRAPKKAPRSSTAAPSAQAAPVSDDDLGI